jgi:hypothetical protein
MMKDLLIKREKVVEHIQQKKDLYKYILACNIVIILCSAVFGIVTGTFVGGIQILFNAVKLPMLFLTCLYMALPVFYVVSLYSNCKIELPQMTSMLFGSFSIGSLIMVAFSPFVLLFAITTNNVPFMQLLMVMICGLFGVCSLIFLCQFYRTMHKTDNWKVSMLSGSFVLFISGPQLAWVFRPYFEPYGGMFIRPLDSNFYAIMVDAAVKEPVVAGTLLFIFILIIVMLLYSVLMVQPSKLEKDGSTEQTQSKDSRSINSGGENIVPADIYYPQSKSDICCWCGAQTMSDWIYCPICARRIASHSQ